MGARSPAKGDGPRDPYRQATAVPADLVAGGEGVRARVLVDRPNLGECPGDRGTQAGVTW